MKVRRYGEAAVLVEVADAQHVLALRDALATATGIVELVPAASTLLVRFDPGRCSAGDVAAMVSAVDADITDAPPATTAPPVELPVRYDGPDLAALADELGISAEELVGRHCAATYTVAFCGFSPGFAYLAGLDPTLHAARLPEPRTAVPAGSVAIGGEFTGVYPRSSPGGWRLLGRTEAVLWDGARPVPALLTPGTTVRFVAT